MFKNLAVGTALLAAALALVPTAAQAQDRYYEGGYRDRQDYNDGYYNDRYSRQHDRERREFWERERQRREHERREQARRYFNRRYDNSYNSDYYGRR